MDKLTGFGGGFDEVVDLPNYKHEYMFYYLQLSPSYWLAHRRIALNEQISQDQLPKNFDQVLATYKKLGSVYQMEFFEWWLAGAYKAFGSAKKKQVWLGIDPNKSKDRLRKEFEEFLSKLDSKKAKDEKIVFEVSKLRLSSLHDRQRLVHERAWRNGVYFPKEPLWKLIRYSQFPSEKRKEIRINSKKKQSNVELRSYLTMLASKNLKLALYIAENAARGVFPSQEPIQTGLDFDLDRIARLENEYDWDYEKIIQFRKQNKNHMKYMSPSLGHRKTRKKMPKYDASEALEKE